MPKLKLYEKDRKKFIKFMKPNPQRPLKYTDLTPSFPQDFIDRLVSPPESPTKEEKEEKEKDLLPSTGTGKPRVDFLFDKLFSSPSGTTKKVEDDNQQKKLAKNFPPELLIKGSFGIGPLGK